MLSPHANKVAVPARAEIFDRRLTIAQYGLIAIVASSLLLDGMDAKLLPYLAPDILKEWGVTKAAFAPALAASLFGMTIGSLFGGAFGDRFGPRSVAVASVGVFGVLTLACSLVAGPMALMLVRFGSGLGFGALVPNAYTIAVEWLPRRLQARVMGLLTSCSSLGGVAGAAVALIVLPMSGWRGCFLAVGGATMLVALAMFRLPETPTHLVRRGKASRLEWAWLRIVGVPPSDQVRDLIATASHPSARASVFRRELLRLNVGSWLAFFCAQCVNYGYESWLPVVLTSAGLDIKFAIAAGMFYSILSLIGALCSGLFSERFGSKAVILTGACAVAGILAFVAFMLGAGELHNYRTEILVAIAVAGGASGCMMATIAAVIATGYPPECRATGAGLGVAAGRLGGVTTTLVGGLLLSFYHQHLASLFLVLLIFALVVVVAALVVDRHIEPHR